MLNKVCILQNGNKVDIKADVDITSFTFSKAARVKIPSKLQHYMPENLPCCIISILPCIILFFCKSLTLNKYPHFHKMIRRVASHEPSMVWQMARDGWGNLHWKHDHHKPWPNDASSAVMQSKVLVCGGHSKTCIPNLCKVCSEC